MQIIRNDDAAEYPAHNAILLLPLLIEWGCATVCQIKDCVSGDGKPGAAAALAVFDNDDTGGQGTFACAVCEAHHQEAKARGEFDYTVLMASELKAA
ncbi:MAG: hypothetical protein WC651_03305 [Candidatus Gracilibacteria bacterium]